MGSTHTVVRYSTLNRKTIVQVLRRKALFTELNFCIIFFTELNRYMTSVT